MYFHQAQRMGDARPLQAPPFLETSKHGGREAGRNKPEQIFPGASAMLSSRAPMHLPRTGSLCPKRAGSRSQIIASRLMQTIAGYLPESNS